MWPAGACEWSHTACYVRTPKEGDTPALLDPRQLPMYITSTLQYILVRTFARNVAREVLLFPLWLWHEASASCSCNASEQRLLVSSNYRPS